MMTKLWQSMQSGDTKNMNLDKEIEDVLSTVRKMAWSEEERERLRCGNSWKETINERVVLRVWCVCTSGENE